MIVGGGNVGSGLARTLENDYSVKLVERNQKRAEMLAERLSKTIVFVLMLLIRRFCLKNILKILMHLLP